MIAIRGLGVVALAGCLLAPATLAAQDSKSVAVAGQLTQLLDLHHAMMTAECHWHKRGPVARLRSRFARVGECPVAARVSSVF